MSTSSLGRASEYDVRDELVRLGYLVGKVKASRGKADLMAFAPGPVCRALFVQVKRGTGRLRPGEWNELLGVARAYGAQPILAEWLPRQETRWWRLLAFKRLGGSGKQPYERFDPAGFARPEAVAR